jgi:stress-induced-phosphoprotein 1
MKEYNRCLDACEEAMSHDQGGANAREIESQQQKALEAMYTSRSGETEDETAARIQRDPEIMSILQGKLPPISNSLMKSLLTLR